MSKNVKSRAIAAPMSTREHTSVSVEKISNGYLVRTSTSKGDKWTEKTEYTAQKPKVSIPVTSTKKGAK